MPKELQTRIRIYFHHYFKRRTAFDQREILSNLSVFLRRELGLHLLHSSIFKIPLFQILIRDMVRCCFLKNKTYTKRVQARNWDFHYILFVAMKPRVLRQLTLTRQY